MDGRRVAARLLDSRDPTRPGAGGLPTLRLDAVFDGRPGPARLELARPELRGPDRLAEIVVRATRGARVDAASVPAASVSDELRAYPRDRLRAPLDVTRATASSSRARERGTPPLARRAAADRAPHGGFAALVGRDELDARRRPRSRSPLALFWGAAHALSPGHGKAIVAGYLVGTRGTPRARGRCSARS